MSARPLTIADWQRAYLVEGASPRERLSALVKDLGKDDPAWISRADQAFIDAQLNQIEGRDRKAMPLFGVPFAVKDNIDVAGLPTTAACPTFSFAPDRHATVVERLMHAGAIVIGKTNLDQFATGLVGTRSPYGEVPNTFDPAYVSGGSSAGSASVVARGIVPFALGTDTAGSGRVPAGFNNIVGLKPTPGSVPMQGVLPACRSLDVVSIFALTVADAAEVMAVMEGAAGEPSFQYHAPRPAWLGRPGTPLRIGVPLDPACDVELGYERAFNAALERLHHPDYACRNIDFAPMLAVARLLYEGPWVAERYTVVQSLIESRPEAMDPVVRQVISAAGKHDAVAAFRARYRLEELRQVIEPMWRDIDVLMVPTAPTCPTRAAVRNDPVLRNSELGKFTNFVNLLGMAAIAVPAGLTDKGLPFGVTFIAPGGSDAALANLAARWQAESELPLGARLGPPHNDALVLRKMPAAAPTLLVAVVGAHLAGMPLHHQLVDRGCRLLERTTTSPDYRLYALPGTTPPKPGLARVDANGVAIEVEVYEMPEGAVGSFLALIAPPLGLGTVRLASGTAVTGFICEPAGLLGASDISAFRGWRAYIASITEK
ncbi:MAG: allophanate hydrolase [Betaproteobacteria bacterium]|nr:allophanate hydrolase [Betaproteobacteria bacterium]